jgi:hypothetical protein
MNFPLNSCIRPPEGSPEPKTLHFESVDCNEALKKKKSKIKNNYKTRLYRQVEDNIVCFFTQAGDKTPQIDPRYSI